MKTRIFKNIALFGGLAASLLASSCTGDLDRTPFIEVTSATVYNDPAAYKQAAAKLYAGLALTGQEGPAGQNGRSRRAHVKFTNKRPFLTKTAILYRGYIIKLGECSKKYSKKYSKRYSKRYSIKDILFIY